MIDSPAAWLLVLCALGAILLWCGRIRTGRSLVSVGLLCLALIAVLPVEQWALRPLEQRFPAPADLGQVDGIVVLGGAMNAVLSADRNAPETNDNADRMFAFAALARRFPNARLVFTGGPLPSLPAGPKEADWAKALFASLGIDESRVIYEGESRTTAENAQFTARLIHPATGERWLLVTSAFHMPRAIGAFRGVGLNLIAYPVGYRTFLGPVLHPYSLVEKLHLLHYAAHEWFGMAVYRARGQMPDIFPAPMPPPTPQPAPAPAPTPSQPAQPT
jgi:uncharacterized SAM-binding protein YcdF (DUF218 family)